MIWFNRFWEQLAIRILLRSRNITMVAFKDRECSHVFMTADPTDPVAFAFYSRNVSNNINPKSMMLERLYHAPDAEKHD